MRVCGRGQGAEKVSDSGGDVVRARVVRIYIVAPTRAQGGRNAPETKYFEREWYSEERGRFGGGIFKGPRTFGSDK